MIDLNESPKLVIDETILSLKLLMFDITFENDWAIDDARDDK